MKLSAHFFRHHARGFASLALLAICLHFAAMSLGGFHAARQLAHGDPASMTGMCHVSNAGHDTATDNAPTPAPAPFAIGGLHCPFCTHSTLVLLPAPVALTETFPETAQHLPRPTTLNVRSIAPDFRHAPLRAPPPLSFA
jgi:hypothetical protein